MSDEIQALLRDRGVDLRGMDQVVLEEALSLLGEADPPIENLVGVMIGVADRLGRQQESLRGLSVVAGK